jgi:hypothetical protein
MKRERSVTVFIILAIVLASLGAGSTHAPTTAHPIQRPTSQTYSFSVPMLLMQVSIQPDGSADIVYDITFENYGSPIDIVDIGTPNNKYRIPEMEASIDGQPLSEIRRSEFIDVGVEVHLGPHAIAAGQRGTLRLAFSVPDMVYADTTNKENASLQITPTWFESDLVRGTGTIEIRVATLPGIAMDEVLYQDEPFTDKVEDAQGRIVGIWRYENVTPTRAYRVGISFPQQAGDVRVAVIEQTTWDLFVRWLGGAAGILAAIGGVLAWCLPTVVPFLIVVWIIRAVKRGLKPNYLPPIAQVEGGGIKRGLTAPEAAVLLELPLTKVLTLVIFGMLEKGLIRQIKEDPLTVEVVEAFRVKGRKELTDDESRDAYRRKAAQQKGTIIHRYEQPFLTLIEEHPATPVSKMSVVSSMRVLVEDVAAKMQGFDLSDTQDYYRRVIDRAMEQAASIGDVEQREAYLDKYLPWVMMRPNYRPVVTMGSYNYWPVWARQTSPGAGTGARPTGGASTVQGSRPAASGAPRPTFGDVSASFAGWAETTMGGMAAAIMPTALSKPAPISTGGGSSSSGGGSSCACACAGCACACACAGGGR